MYSNTRKWINPHLQEQNKCLQERTRLNTARRRFCPNSPFFYSNFDLPAHKIEIAAESQRHLKRKLTHKVTQSQNRKSLELPPTPSVKPAFNSHEYTDNFSPVLSFRTVFTPAYDNPSRPINPLDHYDKEPGKWPCKAEMKYEGDERISTDKLHGRYLPAPRNEGNETVNWMHRSIVPQYPLDDFHYPPPSEVEVWIRTHVIAELELTDEEGIMLVGEEIMEMIDFLEEEEEEKAEEEEEEPWEFSGKGGT